MKTKTKKIMLGLSLALLGCFTTKAQSGLDGIIVEKYYQTNTADGTNASNNGAASNLNSGSVTYRVFVDMAAGWKFVQAFGNGTHPWVITTSTNFYNDPNSAAVVGAQVTSTNNIRQNTRMIDSYITTGYAANGKHGILKTEDTDGSIGITTSGVLTNTLGGIYGVAINSNVAVACGCTPEDGLTVGSTTNAPTSLGLSPMADVFDQSPGNTFSITNGAMAVLGGVDGTGTSNAVLIGQFTTDGVLGFQLNIQLQNTLTLVSEVWVANNPQSGEFMHAGLTLAPNQPPTVSLTGPSNIITGNVATFSATAADADGTVTSVQFKVDGVNLGSAITGTTGASTTYTANWTSVAGTHTVVAVVTDDDLAVTTSTNFIIVAATNQSPVVTVSAPSGVISGQLATFTATANDLDGTVSSVTFSVDNVAIGTTTVGGPSYTMTWTAAFGSHNVKASAQDNLGAIGVSSPVAFNVVNNVPPTVSIVTPVNNAIFTGTTSAITISATAADSDGTVTSVEFFANNVSIGIVTSPYTVTWTPTAFGPVSLKAVALDNAAGTGTSALVTINIANPNALPYSIGEVKQQCNQGTFCLPISAASTYTVDDVIGYDIVLHYNPAKVTPTGTISVNSNIINPNFVTVVNSFGGGTMNISAYFNNTAPGNAEFNGTGEIFCVGFVKTSMTSVDTAVYSISSLDESYFIGVTPKLTSNGRYVTYRDTTFSAKLKFAGTTMPLAYNSANPNDYLITNIYGSNASCVTNTANAVQPDLNGAFVYNILNGSSINIKRDILAGTSVQLAINGNDVFIGRQILLNSTTLTPSVYQMIALDVNFDGSVSSGDISQINLRSTLAIPEFKQAWNYNAAGTNTLGQPSKDWTFVDSVRLQTNNAYAISATYPLNDNVGFSKFKVPATPFCLPVPQTSLGSCPTINDEVYRGVMIGDADGNFAALSGTLQLRPSDDGDKVVIDLTKSLVHGNSVEVPVSFVSSSPVVAVDFALQFDQSNMIYNSMVNFASNTDASAYLNPSDKTLRFTATNVDLSEFNQNQPVASIRFELSENEIKAEQFNGLFGILNGGAVPIQVVGKTVGLKSLSGDNSVSVYPNPSSGILNITSISDANVEVFDVTGKQSLVQSLVNANKTQQINVSTLTNGVYMVKISSDSFVTIKKVVISK